jgi:hypothetical protein
MTGQFSEFLNRKRERKSADISYTALNTIHSTTTTKSALKLDEK